MEGAKRAKSSNMKEFTEADILIAADVTYDVSVIECLVTVIHAFLLSDPKEKEVILAITRRNLATFKVFLQHLKNYNIFLEWILDGNDCKNLPKVFKSKFHQSRFDVRIASLKFKS
jgi:hypothetical protein